MEKCLFNNEIVYASKCYVHFPDEKSIKHAGWNKQLKCIDSDCGEDVIFVKEYTRAGGKVSAFFRHKNKNVRCEYADYAKTHKRNPKTIELIHNYYNHATKMHGEKCPIAIDVKLGSNRWADIFIETESEKIVIKFVWKYANQKWLSEYIENLKGCDMRLILVVIDELDAVNEYELRYSKRLPLNDLNGILFLQNPDDDIITLVKHDTTKYYNWNNAASPLFEYKTTLDEIDFLDDEFASGFFRQFNNFVSKRKIIYKKHIKEFDRKIAATRIDVSEGKEYYYQGNQYSGQYAKLPYMQSNLSKELTWDEIFRQFSRIIKENDIYCKAWIIQELQNNQEVRDEFLIFYKRLSAGKLFKGDDLAIWIECAKQMAFDTNLPL